MTFASSQIAKLSIRKSTEYSIRTFDMHKYCLIDRLYYKKRHTLDVISLSLHHYCMTNDKYNQLHKTAPGGICHRRMLDTESPHHTLGNIAIKHTKSELQLTTFHEVPLLSWSHISRPIDGFQLVFNHSPWL